MRIEIRLNHGATGQPDIDIELTDSDLLLKETTDKLDNVCLDRWQIAKLKRVLELWDDGT